MKLTRRDLIKVGALTFATSPLTAISAYGSTELIQPAKLKSSNGVLNVTLEAKPTMLPFNGGKRWALTYNGTFPGPTLVAKPGDTINVTLKNSTNMMTNLHTHGPHLPPSGNSDNPFIMVAPGDSFKYSFKIRKDQEPGTFWYHPHHHEFVAKQLSAGLAGAIIIEGESDKQLANTTDRVLVFADPRIGTSDSVMNTSMMDQMHGRTGDYLLINGQLKPTISAKKGVAEHWRLVNASPSLFLNLSLDDADLFVIGTDGGRVNPFYVSNLRITPGQRYEILVYPKSKGTLNVRNDGAVIATLNTDGSKAKAPSFAPIPALKATVTKSLKIAQGGGGMMGRGYGPGWRYHQDWSPGAMGPGMMGPGMMGPMMGSGMMGWYGQPQANLNLSVDDVRGSVERWIAMTGNPRLKPGKVTATNADTITAEVVTVDKEALVQRYAVNRHTGYWQQVP